MSFQNIKFEKYFFEHSLSEASPLESSTINIVLAAVWSRTEMFCSPLSLSFFPLEICPKIPQARCWAPCPRYLGLPPSQSMWDSELPCVTGFDIVVHISLQCTTEVSSKQSWSSGCSSLIIYISMLELRTHIQDGSTYYFPSVWI